MREFVPTSDHANWKGKMRCQWCPATGWPDDGLITNPYFWALKHGERCKHRPQEP